MSDHPTLVRPRRPPAPFADRHIGPDAERAADDARRRSGFDSLDALMDAAVPGGIRAAEPLDLPPAATESRRAATSCGRWPAATTPLEPMIGLGYHGTVTPAVVRRNVLEDPSWYTAYTPYQPEISQGRLEALLNFQTMVADLTGLPTANASLLDEGTAAAEAMTLVRRANQQGAPARSWSTPTRCRRRSRSSRTRAEAMGIEVVVADLADGLPDGSRRRAACSCSTPAPPAGSLDPRPADRRGARARRRWPSSPPTCSR